MDSTTETCWLIDVHFEEGPVERHQISSTSPHAAVEYVANLDWGDIRLFPVTKIECVGSRITTTTIYEAPLCTKEV